ncbi:hypothetical protein EVAR_94053_1 [Eumeta japonica]|uniref:Uncharacterized protein n=1 Tax=Eumeta variegata TaxID=151549 RepID=A0A4C1V6B2_EUMVA|nr:hypothetical protein EVAR_94053_1 [Eumeta japonica]
MTVPYEGPRGSGRLTLPVRNVTSGDGDTGRPRSRDYKQLIVAACHKNSNLGCKHGAVSRIGACAPRKLHKGLTHVGRTNSKRECPLQRAFHHKQDITWKMKLYRGFVYAFRLASRIHACDRILEPWKPLGTGRSRRSVVWDSVRNPGDVRRARPRRAIDTAFVLFNCYNTLPLHPATRPAHGARSVPSQILQYDISAKTQRRRGEASYNHFILIKIKIVFTLRKSGQKYVHKRNWSGPPEKKLSR